MHGRHSRSPSGSPDDRSADARPAPPLYRALARVGGPIARRLVRPRVVGREHLPTGGFVLASNHLSGFDSLALAYALYPRALRSMAKAELFERRLLGPQVSNSAHSPPKAARAVEAAAELARGMPSSSSRPARAGERIASTSRVRALRAALRAGAPLVPAAVHGTERWRRLARWHVALGPPVRLDDLRSDDPEAAQAATRRLWQAIGELEGSLAQGTGSGTTGARTASGSR